MILVHLFMATKQYAKYKRKADDPTCPSQHPNASIVGKKRNPDLPLIQILRSPDIIPPRTRNSPAFTGREREVFHLEDLALVALGREHDVVLELEGGVGIALEGLEVHDKVVLDGEDGVGLQPGVVLGVQLGRAALILIVRDLVCLPLATLVPLPPRVSYSRGS